VDPNHLEMDPPENAIRFKMCDNRIPETDILIELRNRIRKYFFDDL
jgi:hypothetical protein